ncbi:SAM-dependent methyltransferase, partial [Klebsiella pneumoniae]|nr:SAM-dependent methyltransferase [Klebsiella pneumoniae]
EWRRNPPQEDTLTLPLAVGNEELDFCVTIPPFGGTEEDGIEKNFPAEMQTRETAERFPAHTVVGLGEKGRPGGGVRG